MKYFFSSLALLSAATLLVGCNETTRKDVTSAQNKVDREERKLDDAKREEARTAQKPVIDETNKREQDRAHDRVVKQEERVREAQTDASKKAHDLNVEQGRDTFLVDCKAAVDLANRNIEKLETKKNAATEDEKMALDRKIEDIKAQRDAVQKEINNIRTSDVDRWQEFKPAAQKAMDELSRLGGSL